MNEEVKVGQQFKLQFPGSGNQTGALYEVYHISNNSNAMPSTEKVVFLKLVSRSFFQLGAPFSVNIPLNSMSYFFYRVLDK